METFELVSKVKVGRLSKSELAGIYGIHRNTFCRMLKRIGIADTRKRLEIAEVQFIYRSFGIPGEYKLHTEEAQP